MAFDDENKLVLSGASMTIPEGHIAFAESIRRPAPQIQEYSGHIAFMADQIDATWVMSQEETL